MKLLLGQQKQTLDMHGIGYNESSEVILLKQNTLERGFLQDQIKKCTPKCLVC